MGKAMTKSERVAYEWLVKAYGPGVKYNYNKSPDFVLPDGSMFEAKYLPPRSKILFFTRKQWEELPDNVVIIVVSDKPEPLCTIPFSELKEKRRAVCGDREVYAYVEPTQDVLRIRCSRETLVAFRRYAAEFRDYEEALISLLERAGVYVRRFEVR
jgi:hypothetical protein